MGAPDISALSREVALTCDFAGVITWADERAARLLGAHAGVSLRALAAPDTEEKVARLFEAALVRSVDTWELVLLVQGAPATLAFRSATLPDGLLLVGSLVPQDYAAVLAQVGATMSELADLYRETERQQRELTARQAELTRVNRDLQDSNRGVVTLYAELDEKAESLHRMSEVKTRIVANVSHEFRTPLNSILGLSRLLLDRVDGPLTEEQDKQVKFIRTSAEVLSELVNDLLDLSKTQAGKNVLRPIHFNAGDLFGGLRGMLRPIQTSGAVDLVFEDVKEPLEFDTDEGKLSQILRNLVSNALKFTEKGEVRVRAEGLDNNMVRFSVSDTGIGIAPADQERIFEEFTQIDSPVQRRVKGTGLGLSLSRRLAEVLGGELTVTSTPGRGSTFCVTIPAVHPEVREMTVLAEKSRVLDPSRAPVLVVEDDRQTLFLYEKYLSSAGFQIVPARSIDDARKVLGRVRPAALVLDIMLDGESSWAFLAELKSNPETRDIPVLVVTVTNREQKARALGADEFWLKPVEQSWLLRKLRALAHTTPVERILVIDDDEVARYLMKRLLTGTTYRILEAASGTQGIELAREMRPQVIFLDFVLSDMTAFDVLDELKIDPRTRDIPVILHTSKDLHEEERKRLAAETAAILSKQSLSREVAIARIREALVKAGVRAGGFGPAGGGVAGMGVAGVGTEAGGAPEKELQDV